LERSGTLHKLANTSSGGFAAYKFTTSGVNDNIALWTPADTLDYDCESVSQQANQLAMDKVQAIKHLEQAGFSERRIAEQLGISRKAVRHHLGRSTSKETDNPIMFCFYSASLAKKIFFYSNAVPF
jgi:predicted XRE-type DNA-binding protein